MSETKQKRMTKQKRVVYDILSSATHHPTVDWIYQQARQHVPDISLGTVYRNLQVLLEDKRINELSFGKDPNRYEACNHIHYHFICDNCGEVMDFPSDTEFVPHHILERAPGQVLHHRLECHGICAICLTI